LSGEYDHEGPTYTKVRVPDRRIEEAIRSALGPSASVLNLGAGPGSYEPTDRSVVAVEPSASMVGQRPPTAGPAVRATAEDLPFRDGQFEAALAVLTLHHWHSIERGITETRRVTRSRVVILTWDPESQGFWLTRDYFPEILAADRASFPTLDDLSSMLGPTEVCSLPVPHDCTDGFLGAYWRRPRSYLDEEVRKGISVFSRVRCSREGFGRLERDLATGDWHRRHGPLLDRESLDIGYRILVSDSNSE
jgi:SAM-dependent methyltransferase